MLFLPLLRPNVFSIPETFAATAVAFVIGYIVIAWLLKFVATKSFMPFIIYRISSGLNDFLFFWQRVLFQPK